MNKKLNTLITKHDASQPRTIHSKTKTPTHTQPRVINLTNITLTQEQMKVLSLGPQYALEQKPSTYINELIIEIENAIKKLEPKWQNMYRHQATTHMKQIKENNKQNPLHKWQQNLINKVKKELTSKNITITKADKSKAIVMIHKMNLQVKIIHFLQNNITQRITKDPTDKYNKQIHRVAQQCKLIINKQTHKHRTNLQPGAPKLNVVIKTHKEDMPIRPVVNNTRAPSHKITKFLNTRLKNMEILPNTYNIKNSLEIAQEISKIHTNQHMKLITLDIKDLYTNLPTQGITQATKFWLHNRSHQIEENR